MSKRAISGIVLALLWISILTTLVHANVGGYIDVYTQYPPPHGGQGPQEPSEPFAQQDEIVLFALVTYNLWPVHNVDVTFEIIRPNGEILSVLTAVTDEDGVASTSFRIPQPDSEMPGNWEVSGTVNLADEIYIDTLTFEIDITLPQVTVHSPENITYTTNSIPLVFTIGEPWSWAGYNLDNQANVTITGNTTLTGLSYGMHGIIVYANDTVGNMGYSNTTYFVVSLLGDLNDDGVVDGEDLSMVALAYGSYGPDFEYPGSPPSDRWNPTADLNDDNVIDGGDLVLVCKNFGKSYP